MEFYDEDRFIYTAEGGFEEWVRSDQTWTKTIGVPGDGPMTDESVNRFIDYVIETYGEGSWGKSIAIMRSDALLDGKA